MKSEIEKIKTQIQKYKKEGLRTGAIGKKVKMQYVVRFSTLEEYLHIVRGYTKNQETISRKKTEYLKECKNVK